MLDANQSVFALSTATARQPRPRLEASMSATLARPLFPEASLFIILRLFRVTKRRLYAKRIGSFARIGVLALLLIVRRRSVRTHP